MYWLIYIENENYLGNNCINLKSHKGTIMNEKEVLLTIDYWPIKRMLDIYLPN